MYDWVLYLSLGGLVLFFLGLTLYGASQRK